MNLFFSEKNWNKFFLYTLFISSTFSIAGIDASISFLYLITLITWIKNRRIYELNKPMLWAIIFFITTSVCSGLINEYETEHLMALRTNWRLIIPLILAVILIEIKEERLLVVFFFFVMLIAIYGIIQFFTGADWLRPESQSFSTPYVAVNGGDNILFHGKGNFSHHLTFGGYLLICFALFSSLIFCKDWNPLLRLAITLITILILLAIISSLGRSIWLGTFVTTLILLFRFSPKFMFFLTISFFVILSYFYIQFGNYSFQISNPNSRLELFQKRILSSFKIKSNEDRIFMWESGLAVIKDHFWFGIGFGNDAKIMPSYREKISKRTGHRFWTKASTGVHNIYLQTWLNYGILGFLGYLNIFFIFLTQSIVALKKTKKFSYENSILWAGISGIGGFMIAGFFENNFRDGEVQAILLILMGISLYQIQKIKNKIL